MNKRYEYKETISKLGDLYPNLCIDSSNPLLNIFRITSGSINLKDSYSEKNYKLRQNYLKFPYEENKRISKKSIINNFSDEISLQDLNNYFAKAKSNIKFYESIEIEILKCTIALNENRILESFFYLYRILEGISYSIPLIYVSKKTEYNKSYKHLATFFSDKNGELAFFKTFISEIFGKEDFYQSTIDIDFNCIDDEELKKVYYQLYYEKINEKRITNSVEDELIQISFIGFYELLIELRNRFFHNLKGTWQDNFESNKLLYPDIFFKPIINHGINWISIIIFEIIKVDFEKLKM